MRRDSWRTEVVGALAGVVAALALACGPGGGGSLPEDPDPPGPAADAGTQIIPEVPVEPVVPAKKSLWPLTTGSRWTYRIDDPMRGVFEKKVEVLGVMDIPGTRSQGIVVKSTQPHLEELSWQVVADGVVLRVREEDRDPVTGALKRVTTWDPLTMKALDGEQATGWSRQEQVTELVSDGSGNVVDTKVKDYAWAVDAVGVTAQGAGRQFEGAVKLRRLRSDKDTWPERRYWLVPGIGKVREEGERLEELVDFEIKE